MLESALTTLLLGAQLVAQPTPIYHAEREAVAGGAELVTVFGRLEESGSQAADVPLLSVLRDSLGDNDPDNDRLRYVWILTSTPPTPLQRVVSALSFTYFRAGGHPHAGRLPKPTLDLTAPSRNVWPNLFGDGLQALRFDPMGAPVRSSTRSYRGNSSDYRELQVFQALTSLDGLAGEPAGTHLLSDQEMQEVYSRLSLSNRTFGGLVREENLSRFYERQASRREQNRGHNWELLRQRAELNGFYFEPLGLPDDSPSEALLWIARADLERRPERRFNPQFLKFANPWTDDRLLHWTGASQTFYFDQENRPVAPGEPDSHPVEMIPLALYSLDYPRAPLLLVDFRNGFEPKRREVVRQGARTLFAGVLGIARFGNWPFFAANSAWTFVNGRRGNAVNRSARLQAYSGALNFLLADSSLDPDLRTELLHRLDHLALNPLENAAATEASIARQQYAALSQYAQSPTGLEAKLERDRRRELDSYTQPSARRFLSALGRVFTGEPRLNPAQSAELQAQLDSYRKAATETHFLEQVLASSPQPDVSWDAARIRRSVESVSAGPQVNPRTAHLIGRIFASSEDDELRAACIRALRGLDTEEARNELARLARDSSLPAEVATAPVRAVVAQSGTH